MRCFGRPNQSEKLVTDLFHARGALSAKARERLASEHASNTAALDAYMHENPAQIPEIARKLSERILHAFRKQHNEHVDIGADAFKHVISRAAAEGEGAKDVAHMLFHEPCKLVTTLMESSTPSVQTSGVDLLTSFIKYQTNMDLELDGVNAAVAHAIRISSRTWPAEASQPVDEELVSASLLLMHAYVIFYAERKDTPPLLVKVEDFALGYIESEMLDGSAEKCAVRAESGQPAHLAFIVLKDIRRFMEDLSTSSLIIETLFSYLDKSRHWRDIKLVEGLIKLMAQDVVLGKFHFFVALMHHSSAEGLGILERHIVLSLASQQGISYSLSTVEVCLRELPRTLAVVGSGKDALALRASILDMTRYVAREVGDASQLLGVVASSLDLEATAASKLVTASIECSLAVVEVIKGFSFERRKLSNGRLPGNLIPRLAAAVLVYPPEEPLGKLSMDLLGEICRGIEGLQDASQASLLVNVVYEVVLKYELPPKSFGILAIIVTKALSAQIPVILLNTARLIATLRRTCVEVLSGPTGAFSPLHSCCILLLLHCTMKSLWAACYGDATPCAHEVLSPEVLRDMEGAVGALKVLPVKLDNQARFQPLLLVVPSNDTVSEETLVASKRALESLKAKMESCSQWTASMATSLAGSAVLRDSYGDGVEQKLKEVFVPISEVSKSKSKPTIPQDSDLPLAHLACSKSQLWSSTQQSVRKETEKLLRVIDILESEPQSESDASAENSIGVGAIISKSQL